MPPSVKSEARVTNGSGPSLSPTVVGGGAAEAKWVAVCEIMEFGGVGSVQTYQTSYTPNCHSHGQPETPDSQTLGATRRPAPQAGHKVHNIS